MKAQLLPDGGKINRSSVPAMQAWSQILGAGQSEILVAVAAVGPFYEDVRAYLEIEFCFSSRASLSDDDDNLLSPKVARAA